MARPKIKRKGVIWKGLLSEDRELTKSAVIEIVEEILETEVEQNISAAKALDVDGDQEPRPFIETLFNEAALMFSPDGNGVAYVSDESG